jgi:hypothetical protein
MSRKSRGSSKRSGRNGSRAKGKRKRESGAAQAPPVSPRQRLLSGPSPGAILERIVDGDPLGLEARCRKYLREWAVMIDLERLFARTAARISYHAWRENGTAGDDIVEDCLANAVEELMTQDRDEIELGEPIADDEGRYSFLTETLGLDPESARIACVAFNDLPPDVRRCYWEVAVEGRSIERCVSLGLGDALTIDENVRRALRAISGYKGSGPGGSE